MVAAGVPAGSAHADAPRQRLLVTYRSLSATAEAGPQAEAHAAAALPNDGSEVVRAYATLPSVAVLATDSARQHLEASPEVLSVTPDRDLHATDDTAAATPTTDAAAAAVSLPPVTGAGWTVAVVDTGVDPSHP